MPYQITKFGSYTLPIYDGSDDVGSGAAKFAGFELSGGGQYDSYGTAQAPPAPREITIERQIVADSAADFKSQAGALLALKGTRDNLWRNWDTSVLEFIDARLIDIRGTRSPGLVQHQPYQMRFAILGRVWSSETQTSDNTSINTSPKTVTLTNNGNATVTDPIITISGSATPITSITIAVTDTSEIVWTGSLGSGDTLVIDCGDRSVQLNGADDYASFSYGAGHEIGDWLRLDSGSNSVEWTVAPAGALPVSQTTTYYDGWQ